MAVRPDCRTQRENLIRDHVWVDGRDEHHPEGRYYLEWYEDGKRRRKPVASYDLLIPAARAKSIELNAVKAGLITLPEAPVHERTAGDDGFVSLEVSEPKFFRQSLSRKIN